MWGVSQIPVPCPLSHRCHTLNGCRKQPKFRGEMTSEKRTQKFHTDDVPLTRSNWLKEISRAALNQLGALSRPG